MFRRLRVPALVLSLALLVPMAAPPVASAADRAATAASVTVSGADRSATPDSWWGVGGTVLCGLGIRLAINVPVIGMNPYVLAATIGGCLLMLLDCL